MKPKAILLDLDNTVYNYAPCNKAGVQAVILAARCSREQYDLAKATVKDTIPTSQGASHCRLLYCLQLTEDLTGRTDLIRAREWHAAFWSAYFEKMKPDDGVAEMIAQWKQEQVRIGWVTDFTTERQILKLEKLELLEAADFMVTSEQVGVEKPHDKGARLALKKLGCEPGEAWFIGDDLQKDVAMALDLKMQKVIWMNRSASSTSSTSSDLPYMSVSSWGEILEHWNALPN